MKNTVLKMLLLIIISSCARLPITERSESMRKASAVPELKDDLDYKTLIEGIKANLVFIKESGRVPSEIVFGKTKVTKQKYIQALEQLVNNAESFEVFAKNIKENFDFYEVYGNDDWGNIKATSYYSPLLKGSKKKTKQFSQALYLNPKDMVYIDVDAFAEVFPKWKTFKEQVLEQKSNKPLVKARLLDDKSGQTKIVPYYTREDIDDKKIFDGKELTLVYVDPIKAFFLQIQGSGIIELQDGTRFTVGYAGQNGHPYVAIGSVLTDKIPKEKMSMQSLETYLKSLPPKEMQKILNKNPSYVFFQQIDSKPITYLGTEVVDGRTVATDQSLFPKGTLAYLEFEKPIFENLKSTEPKEWQKSSRFVLDQDTGGAIRGPARLDLYAGSGADAEQFAGVMKNAARLYYLVPKSDYLDRLAN